MISQLEYSDKMWALVGKKQEMMPEVATAYTGVMDQVYKDAALSMKTKRLMSLAVALNEGCHSCILTQTKFALELGASVDEILETCGVAISMGGTLAVSEALIVIQYLEELKKI